MRGWMCDWRRMGQDAGSGGSRKPGDGGEERVSPDGDAGRGTGTVSLAVAASAGMERSDGAVAE